MFGVMMLGMSFESEYYGGESVTGLGLGTVPCMVVLVSHRKTNRNNH